MSADTHEACSARPNSAAAGDGGERASMIDRASFGGTCRFAAAPEPRRYAKA
jgi:hypothetical protein